MADTKTSTFVLSLKGNAPDFAHQAAEAVDELSQAIEKSEAGIKAMSADLRKLKGSSDEVKGAKNKLKASIQAEQQAITKNALELKKLGASTTDYAKKQRALADQEKKNATVGKASADAHKARAASLKSAIGQIGGPAEKLVGTLDSLSSVTEGLGVVEGGMAVAAVGAAVAIGALVGAAGYAIAKFGEFVVASQSQRREMNLMRVASTGAEVNAEHLGQQIDNLAKRVPTGKAELNKLGIELTRTGLRGQTVVDTMNAVAEASVAGGDELGATVKDLVTRNQLLGRFQLTPQELFGKGIRFDDIAAELAKGMNIGIGDARKALLNGQVPLAEGAAALRSAVERKFAGVNKALMLDPGHQAEKFKENLQELVSGVNIEPLLLDARSFFDLFDSTKSKTGAALKQIATALGGDIIDAIHEATPVANDFVRGLVLGALKIDNYWLQVKVTIKKAIEEADKAIDKIKNFDATGAKDLANLGGKLTGKAVGATGFHRQSEGNFGSVVSGFLTGGALGAGVTAMRLAGQHLGRWRQRRLPRSGRNTLALEGDATQRRDGGARPSRAAPK